ncbi:hypothetical protein BDR06DRAFT_981777 [Suillus hirtellus]|nr:hypothetical protein BDR06DRAFT_981777 [Suillus hirtellus]
MDTESVRVQQEEIDRLKRSLYGSVAVEVKQFPVVLALEDMTGSQAVTTDNPTESYFWTFPCFLHSLNTLIGEICSFLLMKQTVLKSTCIVNFFNSSHYWGGQLNGEVKKQGINQKMKQNCKSRFYTLILQSMSVLAYWSPLLHTCLHPDAQKQTNNQTLVAPAVVATVLHDLQYWKLLNQLVKTLKFLIDAIGNLESWEATLTDCMLELIRCARQMSQLKLNADDDDTGFWMHAKSLHSLALFLHPMYASKGRPFKFMVKTALTQKAKLLVDDLKAYNLCCTLFSGGHVDGLAWWESLTAFAITLLSIVLHVADVKHLFSDMGSTQSPKHCNLSIWANLCYHSHQKSIVNGKPICRCINIDVAADLKANFAWAPPLAPQTQNIDDDLTEPIDGNEVLEGQVYDFAALEQVDQGLAPKSVDDEIMVVEHTSHNDGQWDTDVLMSSNGVS